MQLRGVLVTAVTVALIGVTAPATQAAEAPSIQRLGHVLTKAEKQSYRCGQYRGDRPVRAFVEKRAAYRLVPRQLLQGRDSVVLRCGYARPHPVAVQLPAVSVATPAPAPVPVPVAPPAPTPTWTPPPTPYGSTCRYEIGDPTRAPAVSGLEPVNELDVFDPSPEVRQATIDPMVLWNTAPNRVTDDGHLLVTFSDGQEYLHPVGSFNFALASLRQYRLTGERVWLDRALTAAADILAVATPAGQLPHGFPWPGPVGQLLIPGGYSAMAQGEALSLAVRLYRITGEQHWRDVADQMFATLATPGTEAPAVTFVDTDGYLWFEEFPMECPSRVWNGHVFATFAMADYYHLTGSQRALELFDAGATTALHYMPVIRVPGQRANYNVSHVHGVDIWYQRMMTNQLRDLATITGSAEFTTWADLMFADAH